MGCLLSLLCGIRESERRSRRTDERVPSAINNVENNNTEDEILIYCPENTSFRQRQASDAEYKRKEDLGIPLKRKSFKWRLEQKSCREDLDIKRQTFWETCHTYGGQAQVWDALKLICQDDSEDLELANGLLDSCGVILPYGQLAEIYDSKGFRYNLPPYCVCDPVFLDTYEKQSHKSCAIDGENDMVKIRLSDGKDFMISMEDRDSVSGIKEYIREKENIDSKRRMVVLWRGKVLDDCTMLQSLNLPRGAVLQVMVP